MELVVRPNYYLNLAFGIDIKKFQVTCILILTQSQSGSKNMG